MMQNKKPGFSDVFAAVASDGWMMPPHFIEARLEINTGDSLKTLTVVLLPWICENHGLNKFMLIQDSVPAHGSKNIQNYLKGNLPMFVPKDNLA